MSKRGPRAQSLLDDWIIGSGASHPVDRSFVVKQLEKTMTYQLAVLGDALDELGQTLIDVFRRPWLSR